MPNETSWWKNHKHLSDELTPESWYDVMRDWDAWQNKGYRMYFRGEAACLNNNTKDTKACNCESDPCCCHRTPYPLLPSLLREEIYPRLVRHWQEHDEVKDVKKLERQLLDHYIRHTAHLIESEGQFGGRTLQDLEILCLAQHYGLPTRLLDWTLNPFVAMYFALAGSWKGGVFNEKEPSRLWVMILKEEKNRKERTIHLERRDQETKDLSHIVSLDVLGQQGDLSTNQWAEKAPFIVVPLVFTQRIAAQSGRFIYCSNLKLIKATEEEGALISETEKDTEPQDDSKTMPKPDGRLDTIVTKHSVSSKNHTSDSKDPRYLQGLTNNNCEATKFEYNSTTGRHEPIKKGNSVDISEYPWKHLMCYPMAQGKDKETLLKQLEFRGFHSGCLFPDLGGWATYLRQGFH